MLFEIKDDVEGLLGKLWGLKRLNIGEVSSYFEFAFILIRGTSRPEKIGADSLYILLPTTTLTLEIIYAKS